MKLASLKEGGRDGTLIVVDRELKRAVRATDIVPTLQKAIEGWPNLAPRLRGLAEGEGVTAQDTSGGNPP